MKDAKKKTAPDQGPVLEVTGLERDGYVWIRRATFTGNDDDHVELTAESAELLSASLRKQAAISRIPKRKAKE